MKYTLILAILLSGCTPKTDADTWVKCPCIVIAVKAEEGSYYTEVEGTNNKASFSFYTTVYHQLKDTIQ